MPRNATKKKKRTIKRRNFAAYCNKEKKGKEMTVLVACEESQRICIEFRKRGHEAYSCDIQDCSGGFPEWHIKENVLKIINPSPHFGFITEDCSEWCGIDFFTRDGAYHRIEGKWDLIIAHPPCTYISNAGACRLYPRKGELNQERYREGLKSKEFFIQIYNAMCERICIENPLPSKVFQMPPYTQIIQPYEYGEPWSNRTCLWLKGLPKLQPTNILTEHNPYVSCKTSVFKGRKDKAGFSRAGGAAKIRSKTFWGIAAAMAEQWG